MDELIKFIESNPDSRELKRALAVQMVLKGYLYRQIEEILQVSDSFISKWWLVFEAEGATGLQLNYQGSKGYLRAEQRLAVINWLQRVRPPADTLGNPSFFCFTRVFDACKCSQ